MDEHIAKNLKMLLGEIETIKNSLGPLLNEVKKVRVLETEIKRVREETDSKLRKLEFEVRRASQARPEVMARDVSELKGRLEYLNREMSRLKNSSVNEKELKSISSKVNNELNKVYPKTEVLSKKELTRIMQMIDEIDQRYKSVISSTSAKTAALIPGLDKLERKLENEIKKRDVHFDQMVEEINSEKREIHSDKKNITKLEQRLTDMNNILDKIEKQNTGVTGEIKNRIFQLEKRIASTNVIDKSQTDVQELQIRVLTEQKVKLKEVEERLNKDLNGLREEINRINIKVNNTSKILGDMEKVL